MTATAGAGLHGAPAGRPQPAGLGRLRLSAEGAVWLAAGAVHLLFWVSLGTGWLNPLFNDTMHRAGPGCDFYALWVAGYNAARGASVYAPQPGLEAAPYAYPYRYLPAPACTVGLLLAQLPPAGAFLLWRLVCEACMLLNVRETYRRAGGGLRGALLGAVWLTFTPYFLELWVGQFTFVLGTLLFWCVLRAEEELAGRRAGQTPDGAPAGALALWIGSVLWKPASLLWAPVWLRDRRTRPALAVAGALLLLDLSYFLAAPEDWRLFLRTNVDPQPTLHAGNVGLSALLHLVAGEEAFGPARAAATLLLLLPALWVTLRPCPGGEAPPLWQLAALWTSLFFLVYKDVWEHHLTLLLPFLVLALWRAPSPLFLGVTALLALPSPFVFYDLPHLGREIDPHPYWSADVLLIHHLWRVAPVAAFYGALLAACGAPRPGRPPAAAIGGRAAAPGAGGEARR